MTPERFRLREIEKVLSNQLHLAEEASRLAEMLKRSKEERNRASDALQIALNRWQGFVTRREIPDDLKNWDGTEPRPEPTSDS
jgi:hypothetical protein